MKRNFLVVIAIVLTSNVFGQFGQQVQRFCGSQLDFMEMQRTDTKRYQQFMFYENLLQNQLLNSRSIPTGIITIPVVVHVVYNTSAQNISDAVINEQIQILNEDFRRLNSDRVNTPTAFVSVAGDANIEFELAKIDPNGNTTTGITRTSTSVIGFSQSLNNVKTTSTGGRDPWNTQRYLNIWVCNLTSPSGIMGYSTFPVDLATSPNLDGVVINFNYFGKTDTSSPYDKGRTATHEVGHWLDLRHIWGDSSSCSVDDGVADTPIQSAFTPSFHPDCPSFPRTDACTNTSPGIMFMNYMDYTDDGCMNLFTNGQIARMRALFDDQNGLRRQLLVPLISGPNPDVICYDGTNYTLKNPPSGTIYWTVNNTSLFTVNSSGNPTTVTRIGTGTGSVTLSARTGSTSGTVVATKTITPCAAATISGANEVPCKGSALYTLSGVPSGTYIAWTTTGPLTANPLTGNSTTVTRTGTGAGTLTAKNANGYTIISKSFPCTTQTFTTSPISVNHIEISCGDITIQNVTVNNNAILKIISCGDINVQYVNVQNGAKLILDAAGEVNIISDFEVELDSELEIIK